MSLATPNLEVEIAVANMDLYPYDLPGRPSWGANPEQLVPFLERTGCRNFEVHPTTTIVHDVQQRKASGDTELVERLIGSVHQTFNEGNGLLGKLGDRRGVQRVAASIGGMAAIQGALPRPVQAVGLIDGQVNNAVLDAVEGSWLIVQPSAEAYREYGVSHFATLLERLRERRQGNQSLNIVGICPDTAHHRRRAADGSAAPAAKDDWAGQFASGSVFEMHVGADRQDMAARDPEFAATSAQEFQAFTSRSWQKARETEMGEMIVAAIESWVPPDELRRLGRSVFRMVLEIPPLPELVPFLRRTAQHARFVANLVEIIRETGATPLLWHSYSSSKPRGVNHFQNPNQGP